MISSIRSRAEKEIAAVVGHDGPLTGAELLDRTHMEPLPLWRLCRRCPEIRFEVIGRRFLRLDRAVDGFARLSPSIRREFLTYTLLGLRSHETAIAGRAKKLRSEIERISRLKLDLARESMASIVTELGSHEYLATGVVFIIAGDIIYGMSHAVPRPEKSTGRMVRGSDLDIIVVAADDLPAEALAALDNAIFRRKHYLLVHPDYHEEIDYVVKRLAKVREQLRFDAFKHMVASKILHEGRILYGSAELFRTIKDLVNEHGVTRKLMAMEEMAARHRLAAEAHLLDSSADTRTGEHFNLFYTREEGDEIY
ncbi:MAG: hypothetical protein JXO72_06440 [Vicinamibacteria bacterium]|nr:hypothetical protein [Vicinamibacteria bacterium]